MNWSDIRQNYPDEWLVIEAIEAETTTDHKRHLKRIAVLERCSDGQAAFIGYRHWHQKYPLREFYFLHTSREEPDIQEQVWVGIRRSYATVIEG